MMLVYLLALLRGLQFVLLEKQLKYAKKVSTHIEKEELCDNRKTVRAALALSEMCKVLTHVVEETQTACQRVLLPFCHSPSGKVLLPIIAFISLTSMFNSPTTTFMQQINNGGHSL